MPALPNNPDCPLSGTRYCRVLNMRACEQCTVASARDYDELKRDIDQYEALLPEGGIAHLFTERECQFCRGENRGRRRGYAILDMAHPEPKHIQQWLLGKKRSAIGTMVPLQFGICPVCRRRFLTMEYIPLALPLLIGAAGLILFYHGGQGSEVMGVFVYWPFLAWVAAILLGVLAGRLIVRALFHRYDRVMIADVMRHPVVREMTQRGWFPIAKETRIKVMFSKSRLARGLGTAEDED